jgi:hypothetical protein
MPITAGGSLVKIFSTWPRFQAAPKHNLVWHTDAGWGPSTPSSRAQRLS